MKSYCGGYLDRRRIYVPGIRNPRHVEKPGCVRAFSCRNERLCHWEVQQPG